MFVISTLSDNVRIHPSQFGLPKHNQLINQLAQKYANKIVHDLGLVVSIYDILECSQGVVFACQDGAYQSKVKFRVIVFRPFVSEVLIGRVFTQDATGLKITMDFMDDIHVNVDNMKEGCTFNGKEWIWMVDNGDGSIHEMPISIKDSIRFRVESLDFLDVGPVKERLTSNGVAVPISDKMNSLAPMTLQCSIEQDGLGLVDWWL